MERIIKKTIVGEIASSLDLDYGMVNDIVDAYAVIIKREVSSGNTVLHRDFLTLVPSERKQLYNYSKINGVKEAQTRKGVIVRIGKAFKQSRKDGEYKEDINRTCLYAPQNEVRKMVVRVPMAHDEVVSELRKKIDYLRTVIYVKKKVIDVVRAKLRDKRRVQVRQKLQKEYKLYGKSQTKVNKRAIETVYDRMKVDRIKSSYFLDAISAFPIINEYYKEQKIDYRIFNLLILVYHFRQFHISDSQAFGYKSTSCHNYLGRLIEAGVVAKFGTGRVFYTVTLAGKKQLTNLHRYCNKRMRELFREYDKKITDRDGGTWIKYKGKYLNEIDVLKDDFEAENKNPYWLGGADERT